MRMHVWIRCIACIVPLVCIILAIAGSRTNSQHYSYETGDRGQQDIFTPDFSRIGNNTLSYRDACEHPKDPNDANLCIQRETLKTYEKQVTWAKLTFYLGIVGTSAVAASLYYTFQSVRSAARSAKAAEEASFSDRAWILFKGIDLIPASNTDFNGALIKEGRYANVMWVNAGRSPALNVNVYSRYVVADFEDRIAPVFEDVTFKKNGNVTGPFAPCNGEPLIIDDATLTALRERKKALYMHFVTRYNDIFQPEIIRETLYTARCVFQGEVTSGDRRDDVFHLLAMGTQNGCT